MMCSGGTRQAYMDCKDLCFLQMQLLNSGQGLEPHWLDTRQVRTDVPSFLSQRPAPQKHCHWQIRALGIKLPFQCVLTIFPGSLSSHFHSPVDPLTHHFFFFLVSFPPHLTSTWNDPPLLCVTGKVSLLKGSLICVATSKKILPLPPWAKGTFSSNPSHLSIYNSSRVFVSSYCIWSFVCLPQID